MAARERLYVKAYTYRAPLFMVMPEESARRRDPCVSGFCRKICVMDVVFERFKRMYIYMGPCWCGCCNRRAGMYEFWSAVLYSRLECASKNCVSSCSRSNGQFRNV